MPTSRPLQTHVSVPTPLKESLRRMNDTSEPMEFEIFINIPKLLSQLERAMIIKPHRVNRNSLKEFSNTLLETVPELKNQTHEEIESLIDEGDEDVFDTG
jgi:hypothetical protein